MATNRQVLDDFPLKSYEFKKEKDGKTFTTFSISRSYKDKNGEKKYQSITCFPEELLRLANLCRQTYNIYLADKNAQYSNSSVPTQAEPEIKNMADDIDDEIPF